MKACLLIDIGGTNVRAALVLSAAPNLDVLWDIREPTQLGVHGLQSQCIALYQKVLIEAEKSKLQLEAVSIGFPANISLDAVKTVVPGSGQNISIESDEWAGISIQQFFEKVFKDIPVFVINDALAQCWGGLMENGFKRYIRAQQTVVYIGMGTGLGGACCVIDESLRPSFFTDGHLYDIWLEGSSGRCIAEEYLSGTGFFERTGYKPEQVCDLKVPESLQYWRSLGEDLHQLMSIIQSGSVLKRDTLWSQTDQSKLKNVNIWLFGASFAKASPARDLWMSQLDAREHIYVLKEPDMAAMRGLRAQIPFL